MSELIKKVKRQVARVKRTRAHSQATTDRPRLVVAKSNRYIYAQVIDVTGKVLAASHSMKSKEPVAKAAIIVGQEVAKKAVEAGVTKVSFDRRGRKYHGSVKALADTARENGLNF